MHPSSDPPGRRTWVIPEGYIPQDDDGGEQDPRFRGHETACVLNCGDRDASLAITLYFADREPAGPYRVRVPARRTLHLRFNDLDDPEPVPRETDYASVIESDVPVVVQHTRLDSRRQALALLSTMAWST
ncbi:sensory rhodopsin transducer [Luteimonas sp. RD2P54]|uniref:Sensory rhodopsin transducer n=1 Tax=Luteimonas endophytica TaxID=3042023 RepID=A0ABT6JDM8_9GAMM|nr:sensory rhodopsin transducer [Luteimonas endophytica]MDH5824919.1 sensory rhodopsin transducer [Luteimonas endophytica]